MRGEKEPMEKVDWKEEDTIPCAMVFKWRHMRDRGYRNCMHCDGAGMPISTCPAAEVVDE